MDKSDEIGQIIYWPAPSILVPINRHEGGMHNDPFDGVRDWIFEISEWKQWGARESRFLPGAGVSRSLLRATTLSLRSYSRTEASAALNSAE